MNKTSELTKRLNESAEKLSEKNKKIFYDIVLYIRTSNLKEEDAEEFLQQILDSFLNAEQQGISIESILGTSDIRDYCEEIVETYKSTYNSLSRIGDYMMYSAIIVTIISFWEIINKNLVVLSFSNMQLNKFSFFLDFSIQAVFQFFIAVSFIIMIMTYYRKSCFKEVSKFKELINYFIIGLTCICINIAIDKFINNIIFFSVNIFIVFIISIILYLTGRYVSQR